jgi:Holliday junction resolvase-like predicted endonuclease
MIKAGGLGEIAAAKHFLKEGYEVYSSVTDNSTYDLILLKDNVLYRVEVKSVSVEKNGKYEIQLKSVRPNRTGNKIIKFDNTKMDYLVVYIEPEDKVVVLEASSVTQTSMMTLNK